MLVLASIPAFLGLTLLGCVVAGVYYMLVMRHTGSPTVDEPRPRPAPAPRRPARVSVKRVLQMLADADDEENVFFDRQTGGFATIPDEMLAVLESDDPLDEADEVTDLDLAGLRAKMKAKLLLPLPTKAETREFVLREQFCDGLPEGEPKEQMLKVMRGQTGFRSFNGAVERLGLAAEWEAFRDDALTPIVTEWLDARGLPWTDDVDPRAAPGALRQAS